MTETKPSRIELFRQELNRVFDDNLHTKQWHNYVDYAIIGLIVISTLEVFLSTYDGIVERYGKWLHFVDYFTTIFFTIEVSLRIWCADLLDEKYKGFKGRLRYCFSFYGLIDILSTYPFYLQFFTKVPYSALKALRIARLLRIFRYMKAFSILSRAIRAKKQEMVVSLQFLTIVTLILSFILFFVEHAAQPEVYDNGWTSVVWAFAQYIGDPGGFADTPPITFTGRIIACIIGVLGIAIFAVPAGLIGSAFTEVMDEDAKEEELKENAWKINEFMLVKSIKRGGIFFPAKNISAGDLQYELGLTDAEVIFAFTTILGNLFYVDKAFNHVFGKAPAKKFKIAYYIVASALVLVGAGLSAGFLWNLADLMMGLMTIINMPVIIILGRYAFRALKDYRRRRKSGSDAPFLASDIGIKQKLDYWQGDSE